MFDIGWTELMVVGIVALIVVGPKDLPKMFRTLGQMTAKARGMAREFQRAMDDAADASGVKDMASDLRKATDPQGMGLDELNKMRNWDPLKDDAKAKPTVSKAGSGAPETGADDDDEAAFDQIASEMDALRKERAASASSSAPATDAPATRAAPSSPRPSRDVADAPATSELDRSEPKDKGEA